MKVLSLFDGISCAYLALQRAGIPIKRYYASEIDKYASTVSKAMFTDIIHLGDIKNLTEGISAGIILDSDLLVAGFPCQDLSIAGKREGLQGKRSGLFWKALEILRQIKPKYFLFENVASMKKEWRDIISRELGVEPVMINSALVSAQSRKRLYWCNWHVEQPEDKHIMLQDILEDGEAVKEKSYTLKASYLKKGNYDVNRASTHGTDFVKIGNVGSDAMAHRVYSDSGKSVTLNSNGGGQGGKTGLYKIGENVRKLTPRECCRLQTYDERVFDLFTMDRADKSKPYMSKSQFYKMFGNAFTVDVAAYILRGIKCGI